MRKSNIVTFFIADIHKKIKIKQNAGGFKCASCVDWCCAAVVSVVAAGEDIPVAGTGPAPPAKFQSSAGPVGIDKHSDKEESRTD